MTPAAVLILAGIGGLALLALLIYQLCRVLDDTLELLDERLSRTLEVPPTVDSDFLLHAVPPSNVVYLDAHRTGGTAA